MRSGYGPGANSAAMAAASAAANVSNAANAIAKSVNASGGNWASGGGFGPGFPSLDQAQQAYTVFNGETYEGLQNSLYDSASYVAAGQQTLTFFQTPIGQGTSWAGGGTKSYSDTNMKSAGQLPANNKFLVRTIEVEFLPTTPTVAAAMPAAFGAQAIAVQVNDAYIFRRAGYLNFFIGDKPYLIDGPLAKFPGRYKFDVNAALSDATTAGANFQSRIAFADVIGAPYPCWVSLDSNTNFNVTLNWPEGVQAISNPARVFVRLNGILYRRSQ